MKSISNVKGPKIAGRRRRRYASSLREEQATATRERILDGFIRTMARGLAEVSIPAVAHEAGVSVPTVYRHFRSKRELFAAVGPYASTKAGFLPDEIPWTLEDEPRLVREIFRRGEALDDTLRAAFASQLGQQARREMMPERLEMHRRSVRRSLPDLSDDDTEHFARVLLILHSSATQRAFKDYLGLGADAAAAHVAWATQTLLRGARGSG